MDPTYTVKLDFRTAFSALERCPDCGSRSLTAQAGGERTVFQCEECAASWYLELGRVGRVDPESASAMARQHS